MEFRVLGSLEIVADGRTITITSERQRALMALLLVHAGQPVSTERIIDALWGDEPPRDGAGTVAFHVSRLRAIVEPERREDARSGKAAVIATVPGGYSLRTPPESIDAIRCERLARDGRERLEDDPAIAVERLTEAMALWRGEPFADVANLPFLQPEIARLDELRLRATEDRFEGRLRLGQGQEIVGELERLVTDEPLREHLRGQLMRALYAAGRQADALRVYREGRRMLSEELGIDPSPELQALELAVLRQDPGLDDGRRATRPRNPYKGLRPFGEADAEDFFGREALVERLILRLEAVSRADGLLLVVGPSGCGKSSVIRAGLLPRLRSPGASGDVAWRIATLLPGSRPIEALYRALDAVDPGVIEIDPTDVPRSVAAAIGHAAAAGSRPLLIVIDQLEEIYTLSSDARVAPNLLQGIADALTADGPRPVVVAALRTDSLDPALAAPSFGPLVQDATEIVAPLTRDELERAIARPATTVGLELEPGLGTELEADVLGRPSALPLLQFALTELVERASGRRVTSESYAAIGGIAGAVGRRAELVFASLDEGDRTLARQLFLRLVSVGEGRPASTRRSLIDELRSLDPDASRVDVVLEAFGRWRLLSFDRDPRTGRATVEPAHEALLTHWARLAEWIRDAQDALWIAARLKDAASEWNAADRDPGFLLTGGRLDLFASWAPATDLRLDQAERDLLDASLAERQRLEALEQDRAQRQRRLERRATNRLRALVAVFAIAAILSSALLALVLRQNEAAAEERAIAAAHELAVAANGQLDADPTLAILLAIESARATSRRGWITEETLDALHWALQDARIPYPTQDAPSAVRLAPDGPRGVYLIPAVELLDLARASAGRTLTSAECRTHLHDEACPSGAPPEPGGDLAVMTMDGLAPMHRVATSGISGTVVRVWSQLPVDLATALAPYAAESGAGLTVSFDDALSSPWPDIGQADVAILVRPGDVADLARQGSLLELSDVLGAAESEALAELPLAEVGRIGPPRIGAEAVEARQVGVPVAVTASSLLWYPAEAFASSGYEPPKTWSELDDLVSRMIADGRTPWCLGLIGGEHDGASGTDWVEDFVIDQLAAGPTDVDPARWPAFGHPFVKSALLRLHGSVSAPGAVLGGPGSAARTPSEWAAAQMGTGSEPRCWLVHGGTDERSRWIEPLRSDLTPILLPLGDPNHVAVRGRVYTLVVLRDRPEVRALVRHVLDAGLGSSMPFGDGATGILALGPAGGRSIPPEEDSLSASLAAALDSGRFWPDASDRMSRSLGLAAVPEAVLRVVGSDAVTAEAVAEYELEALARIGAPVLP